MSSGRTLGPNPQPSGSQGDIVKQDDNSLGRNLKEGGQLHHGLTGQIHIGLGLEKVQLDAIVGCLGVKPLKFQLIHLGVQLSGQNVQGPEAAVVPGTFIFLTGIAKANDEPGILGCALEHSLCSYNLYDFRLLYHGKRKKGNICFKQKNYGNPIPFCMVNEILFEKHLETFLLMCYTERNES